jgi:FkbM family methyltransferase
MIQSKLNYWTKNWGWKLTSFWRTLRRIENWPTAVGLRLQPRPGQLRLLTLRDGLNVICRVGTSDWEVIHSMALADLPRRSLAFLRSLNSEPIVLDLGANIGLFSLMAAAAHPKATVYAYEPGPLNARMIELNQRLNPSLSERIYLRTEAVGGQTRMAEFFYDDENPHGSGLYCATGRAIPVQIRSFVEVINSLPGPVALAKIDIEGAEFELLDYVPQEVWRRITAIDLDLHSLPGNKWQPKDLLQRLAEAGFQLERKTESPNSYFLHRR